MVDWNEISKATREARGEPVEPVDPALARAEAEEAAIRNHMAGPDPVPPRPGQRAEELGAKMSSAGTNMMIWTLPILGFLMWSVIGLVIGLVLAGAIQAGRKRG